MKKFSLLTIGMLGLVGGMNFAAPAMAGNSSIETTLQGFGDTSMFYQALLNTGVINELTETGKYTIFAPVNSAFAQVPQSSYPCFYTEACRPQIAVLLRDHIIDGQYQLADLADRDGGVQTSGPRRIRVNEAFARDYSVENQSILSETEVNGNIIYRIGGVIASPQELSQFSTVHAMPVANTITTERTTVRKVYAPDSAYPAGGMYPNATYNPAIPGDTSTTTVIRSYNTQAQ